MNSLSDAYGVIAYNDIMITDRSYDKYIDYKCHVDIFYHGYQF